MTEITNSVEKDVNSGLPYKFRCRWFGKYDEEFNGVSPVGISKSESDLTTYDGLDYDKEAIISPNATIVGSPTISSDMEVSGFSTSKYLTIPPTFSDSDNWEIMVEFKSSSASATGHFFSSMAGAAGQYAGVDISLSSGKLMLQLGMNGSAFQTITAASAVTANTWYWVKVTFQYSQFFTSVCSFDYSTDGVTFTNIGTLTPSSRIYKSLVTRIGVYGNKVEGQASTVTINLNNCYVKIDNETVWRGTYQQGTIIDFANTKLPWKWGYQSVLKTSKYAVGLQNQTINFYGDTLNLTVTGVPTINTDRLASDFSGSNYYKLPSAFMPASNTWEIVWKMRTTTLGSQQYFYGSSTDYFRTVGGELNSSNKFGSGISSNGTSWDIGWLSGVTTWEANTWYWVKISFTGTMYKLELSTDGENWNLENSIESSTPIYQDSSRSIMFLGTMGSKATYWHGDIDLKECYIKIGDTIWWRGFDKQTLQGLISGDTDPHGDYYGYAINGDDHIELIKKTGSTILAYNTTPRYLGEIDVSIPIHLTV